MDEFEENLQTFNSTIYGSEMRNSLYACFEFIRSKIEEYSSKIDDIVDKINEADGGD